MVGVPRKLVQSRFLRFGDLAPLDLCFSRKK